MTEPTIPTPEDTPRHTTYVTNVYGPPAPTGERKDLVISYVLLIVVGVFGVHQFYLGNIVRGLLYLVTLGFLGVMLVVDLFTLPSQVRKANTARGYQAHA